MRISDWSSDVCSSDLDESFGRPMNHLLKFPRGLYGITPEWSDTDRLLRAVEAAADGGMTALQWRRKTIEPGARLPEARALAALCKSLGVCFLIHDDWPVAPPIEIGKGYCRERVG